MSQSDSNDSTENAAAAAATEEAILPRLTPRQVNTIASAVACGHALSRGEVVTPYDVGERDASELTDDELRLALGWLSHARKLGQLAALVLDGRAVLQFVPTTADEGQVRVVLLPDASDVVERRRDAQPPRSQLIH